MKGSIALVLVLALGDASKRNKRRKWSKKKFFFRRKQLGHARLLREVRDDEPDDYRNFLRIGAASYDELLNLVRPIIQKQERQIVATYARLTPSCKVKIQV